MLFKQTKQNISLHINNIFREKELKRTSVVKESLSTGSDGKKYKIQFFNLDVIISVGYRVKSKKGTHFRIWATNVLREHLVRGFTTNERRLKELQQTVQLISKITKEKKLNTQEATGLLKVITDYTYALDILDKYDHEQLEVNHTSTREIFKINYEEAIDAIHKLKRKFKSSHLFGNEKDQSFKSSISTIYQTYQGNELYPSIEEKAANLLYYQEPFLFRRQQTNRCFYLHLVSGKK
jgi:hypothetical protein